MSDMNQREPGAEGENGRYDLAALAERLDQGLALAQHCERLELFGNGAISGAVRVMRANAKVAQRLAAMLDAERRVPARRARNILNVRFGEVVQRVIASGNPMEEEIGRATPQTPDPR
jgi:hypothetical protein